MSKKTQGPTDPNTQAVVDEVSAQGGGTSTNPELLNPGGGQSAMPHAPGLVKFMKNHKFPIGKILNPDTPAEKLKKKKEVIDPETGKPKRGIRYISTRGNVAVRF